MTQTRIQLIASPRNLSTATMYAFGSRLDTLPVDEPLYAHYLTQSGKDHPGREAVLQHQSADGHAVLHALRTADWGKPVLFIKNMAHHLMPFGQEGLSGFRNVFLIRHPAEMIASFTEVIDQPELSDLGIGYQWELFQLTPDALVVNAARLRSQPRATLEVVCARCGIPFQEEMLSWPAGPKAFDGVWAPWWYGSVHRSTGFADTSQAVPQLTGWKARLLEQAWPFYSRLQAVEEKIFQ